ncbi:MAG TPA: hypothetical protein VGD92_07705 [Sphingobacteriaceae bacterium]
MNLISLIAQHHPNAFMDHVKVVNPAGPVIPRCLRNDRVPERSYEKHAILQGPGTRFADPRLSIPS